MALTVIAVNRLHQSVPRTLVAVGLLAILSRVRLSVAPHHWGWNGGISRNEGPYRRGSQMAHLPAVDPPVQCGADGPRSEHDDDCTNLRVGWWNAGSHSSCAGVFRANCCADVHRRTIVE